MRYISKCAVCGALVACLLAGAAWAEPLVLEAPTPIISPSGELTEDVGLELASKQFAPILKRGCPVPCHKTAEFRNSDDQQKTVKLSLFRGTQQQTAEAKFLGRIEITGFPPQAPGNTRILVTFIVADGRITVDAADKNGSEPLTITRMTK